jgi:hypothetical protein
MRSLLFTQVQSECNASLPDNLSTSWNARWWNNAHAKFIFHDLAIDTRGFFTTA